MKKIISYFIKYPVAVNVVILAFVVFGLFGAFNLKSSFFPLTDSRIIQINIIYPGASPIEIEEGIVLKIEDNLKGLIGIERVTSVSRENFANIVVEAEKGRNIDVVLSDVKNAVDRVPSFPTGMEPPIIAKRENIRRNLLRPDISTRQLNQRSTPWKSMVLAGALIMVFMALNAMSPLPYWHVTSNNLE